MCRQVRKKLLNLKKRGDDTVCLIEVMKCFNTVKADVKGRIVKICAENNQMVEYNQTLYLIDPVGIPEGT